MTLGLDYSAGPPSAAHIKATGAVAVGRYLSSVDQSKCLSARERDDLLGQGLDIWLVYEDAAGNAAGGAQTGARDGAAAATQASGLGAPAGMALYAAVDYQPVPGSGMAAVVQYLRAFTAAVAVAGYQGGVYGSYDVCAAVTSAGITSYAWQTNAWSGGLDFTAAALYQFPHGQAATVVVDGVQCDVNDIRSPDYGGWLAASKGDVVTPDDINAIAKATAQAVGQAVGDAIAKQTAHLDQRLTDVLNSNGTQTGRILDALTKVPTGPGGPGVDPAAIVKALAAAFAKVAQ